MKIENVIIIWRKINTMTNYRKPLSLNTIDIQVDKSVGWNDIKNHKRPTFKTIDNPELIDQ